LFENGGIKGEWREYRTKNGKIYEGKNPKNRNIRLCKPRFTAEKQIELIKWLAKIYELSINWVEQYYNSYRFAVRNYKNGRLNHSVCGYEVPFEETLAYLINRIWQDLTNKEKDEIRNILNKNS
jgi:hypothetical protein